jgi:hypothetical protein
MPLRDRRGDRGEPLLNTRKPAAVQPVAQIRPRFRLRSASYGGRAACPGRHGCELPIQLSNGEMMCVRIVAARCARALRRWPPSIRTRGRRESRMRAASAVSCANMHKKRTRAYRFSGGQSGFPCAVVYGLFRALPGDRALLSPSSARSFASHELDTSVGASGPHGFTVRHSSIRHSPPSRPPHPHRTFVTIASRPLSSGETGGFKALICPTG